MMPHYVWYIEIYLNEIKEENLAHYLIIDASSHKRDRNFSIIKDQNNISINFVNKMKNKKQLYRLTKLD
jgi:uncharacterized protein YdbL (DUF1318 family)